MPSKTSAKTIDKLRRLFAAYGLPEQLVWDNGPQFVSQEFSNFMKLNGIKHIKTSPYHPASNGAVERLVQTFKKAMTAKSQKIVTVSQQLSSFLLSYRTTPHLTTNVTPAELFMSRVLWTRLDLIHSSVESSVNTAQRMQKANHDKKAKETQYLIGQNVMAKNFRNGPKWLPGVIVEQLGILTFLVQLDNGMFWKRHVDQLRHLDDTPREVTVPLSSPEVTSSETFYSANVDEEAPNGSPSDVNDSTSNSATSNAPETKVLVPQQHLALHLLEGIQPE